MDVSIPDHRESLRKNHSKNDVVARWVIPIKGKLYDIELEHGTISGKRVIWVNGEEVLRRDMMYRLVGEDNFWLEEKRCIIHVKSKFVKEKYFHNEIVSISRFSLQLASSTATNFSSTVSSARSTIKSNQKLLKLGKSKFSIKLIALSLRKIL